MRGVYVDDKTVEEQWAAHLLKCPACPLYVEGKPATLAHVCVIGAPLIKALLEKAARPVPAKRRKLDREIYKAQMLDGEKRVGRDQLKRVMRYVGDES